MRHWRGFAAAGVLLVLSGTGCVTTSLDCHSVVRDAGPACEVPRCSRERVYAYLISGVNPVCSSKFDELQACLFRHGFSKVGRVSCFHGSWLVGEMAKIQSTDPEARFVLVGVDVGALTAMRTANRALEKALFVDAVVLLDPVGPPTMKSVPKTRTVLLRSHGGTVMMPNAEIVPVPDATVFNLAASPTTLATIADVMEGVATAVWSESPQALHATAWMSDKLPSGPFSVTHVDDPTGEWSFLQERIGGVTAPLPAAVVEYPVHR